MQGRSSLCMRDKRKGMHNETLLLTLQAKLLMRKSSKKMFFFKKGKLHFQLLKGALN